MILSADNTQAVALAVAVSAGIDVEHYLACLDAGATHAEIISASSQSYLLAYAHHRRLLTHAQAIHCLAGNYSPADYAAACAACATPEQITTASVWFGTDIRHYARARTAGATHSQVFQAYRVGLDPLNYAEFLENGAGHDQALATHAAGITSISYAIARRGGRDHDQAVLYWAPTLEPRLYASHLGAGLTTTQAAQCVIEFRRVNHHPTPTTRLAPTFPSHASPVPDPALPVHSESPPPPPS